MKKITMREWQINISPKLRASRVLLPYLKMSMIGTIDPKAFAIPTRNVPILALIPAPANI